MGISNYEKKSGHLRRLRRSLSGTKRQFSLQLNRIFNVTESPITESQIEDLEDLLITADIGVNTTLQLIENVREKTKGQKSLTSYRIKEIIRKDLCDILGTVDTISSEFRYSTNENPSVIFVVGVNGVGKTTTVGKLAYRLGKDKKVLMCASDTFRAAAADQLSIWAERTQTDIVRRQPNTDPGAVLFDAIEAGCARNVDFLIVDTAGRMHTKSNLMYELEKMKRIAGRRLPGAPHEIYLVLDATTGQNSLVQTREFINKIGITGVIVTKLDGTAKGGIVIALAKELSIPIPYLGIGERKNDLIPFSAQAFVDTLFEERE